MATPFSLTSDPTAGVSGAPRLGFGVGSGGAWYDTKVPSVPAPQSFEDAAGSHYVWEGKARATYTVNVNLNSTSENPTPLKELGFNNLLFVRAQKQPWDGEDFRRDSGLRRGPDGTGQYIEDFREARTLTSMNVKLRSAEWREIYTSAEKIMRDWRWMGVQQTDTDNAALYKSRQDAAITVFIAHRARVPDIWLAEGNLPMVGDHLWLLLIKIKFINKTHPCWQFVPFVSRDHKTPSYNCYNTASWKGAALFIGVVTDRYNEVDRMNVPRAVTNKKYQDMARSAYTSESNDDETKRRLRHLPDVEITLRCH